MREPARTCKLIGMVFWQEFVGFCDRIAVGVALSFSDPGMPIIFRCHLKRTCMHKCLETNQVRTFNYIHTEITMHSYRYTYKYDR